MQVIKFLPEHLKKLHLRDYEKGYTDLLARKVRTIEGPAFTLVHANGQGVEYIYSAGIEIIWNGVGHAWVIMSDLIKRYPLTITKTTKKYLEKLMKEYNLHRVQADVIEGFIEAEAWLGTLGFEYEGPMMKYGFNGENYFRYARLN